ncbi:pantoate--beta-alanine ligase, partial [Candidatus Bipolaricaulota bacterium]|nr:pantoate--beta-alanine ligase [Candidatus Bipolaricaulota bacterium]
FNIVQPQHAYFGQKDAQQALVIRRLIRDLNFPIALHLGPTIREADGLAMSSRNAYLTPEQRGAAPILRRCLDHVERLYAEGERDGDVLRRAMGEILDAEPLALPDYISVADLESLEEIASVTGKALVSLAVRVGKTRLIDNTILPPGSGLF